MSDPVGARLSALRKEKPKSTEAKQHTVLVVDDDAQVLAALNLVLQKRYTVRVTTNPVEASVVGARSEISLVILDVMMPEHDGFWVYSQIRSRGSRVPVIFNSAHQNLKAPAELERLGAFAFLSKSTDMTVF